MKNKDIIREEVKFKRKNESVEGVRNKSLQITQRIVELDSFNASKTVMCYMDFKNEVMTGYLIEYCLKRGKRVVLPLVDAVNGVKIIVPYEITDIEKDLKPGVFGILEPRKERARLVNAEEIDVVVVPGVAFDEKRNRIGYGAGFYDRFLKTVRPDCMKIGIAFEFQIYEAIPIEEHDMPLDLIITESRIMA